MLIQDIIDTYHQDPLNGLALENRTQKDDPDEGQRCSHVRWHDKPCSIVVGPWEAQGPAVWLTIHQTVQQDWYQIEQAVRTELKEAGYLTVMTANSKPDSDGVIFCVHFLEYTEDPEVWAETLRDIALILEPWVQGLKVCDGPQPLDYQRLCQPRASEIQITEATRARLRDLGVHHRMKPAEARHLLEKTSQEILGMNLCLVEVIEMLDNRTF